MNFYVIAQNNELIDKNLVKFNAILYKNPQEAKLLLDSIFEKVTKQKIDYYKATVYNNYGDVYLLNGDFELSLTYFKKANEFAEEFENQLELGKSLFGMGSVFGYLENYILARKHYSMALEIYKNIDYLSGIASIYNDLGRLYYLQNELDKAIAMLERCIQIDRQLNDKEGLGFSYSNLGAFYFANNEVEKAIDYHQKALAIRKEMDNDVLVARSLNNLANAYSSINQVEKAIELYKQSLDLKYTFNNPYDIAVTLNNMGDTYLETKSNPNEAYNYLMQAKLILDTLPATLNSYDNSLYLSRAYEQMDSSTLAVQYLNQYYFLRDSLRTYKSNLENEDILLETHNNSPENTVLFWKYYALLISITFLISTSFLVIKLKKKD